MICLSAGSWDQCQQKGRNGKKGKQQGKGAKLSGGSPRLGEAGKRKAKCKIKLWNPLIICVMWSHLSQLSLIPAGGSLWRGTQRHLCVPGCAAPFLKGLIKSVISDNISVLQNYYPQHVDVFLTGMSKMKLASVGGEI